jgi:hypothetical protein
LYWGAPYGQAHSHLLQPTQLLGLTKTTPAVAVDVSAPVVSLYKASPAKVFVFDLGQAAIQAGFAQWLHESDMKNVRTTPDSRTVFSMTLRLLPSPAASLYSVLQASSQALHEMHLFELIFQPI